MKCPPPPFQPYASTSGSFSVFVLENILNFNTVIYFQIQPYASTSGGIFSIKGER